MIYLSQLNDYDDMQRLITAHNLQFESYEFAAGHALNNIIRSVGRFTGTFRPLYGNGLSLHGPFVDLNPGSFDSMICAATHMRFDACYAAARLTSAHKIVFHTCFYPEIYWTKSWENNSIEFWRKFLHDKDATIQICLENHHDADPEPIARVLDAVDHPAFFACLDVGHANIWSKRPVDDWIDCLGDRIRHLHLNNNNGKEDQHGALDDGTLDIPPLLDRVIGIAPTADWVLEMCGTKAAESSLELIRHYLASNYVSSGSMTGA